jgi:hypothetical protein
MFPLFNIFKNKNEFTDVSFIDGIVSIDFKRLI